jgi:hypothetical protein
LISLLSIYYFAPSKKGDSSYLDNYGAALVLALNMFIMALFLKLLSYFTCKKQFLFYFAKTCVKTSSEEKHNDNIIYNDVNIRYLLLGIDYYNKYLQSSLGMNFKNYDKICQKIAISNIDKTKNMIQCILKSFDNDTDRLEPLRVIFSELELEDQKAFLTKEGNKQKINDSISILIPIITVAVSIVGLFQKSSG